ncbi:MAG: hypothetical protein ABI844_12535 [Saprospiraceae bacterium]
MKGTKPEVFTKDLPVWSLLLLGREQFESDNKKHYLEKQAFFKDNGYIPMSEKMMECQ